MSVLDREALAQSPLADLHAIASELSLDGYRRLRKADLIERILERQDSAEPPAGAPPAEADAPAEVNAPAQAGAPAEAEASAAAEEAEGTPARRRRSRRGGRGRQGREEEPREEPKEERPKRQRGPSAEAEKPEEARARSEDEMVEGVVELLPGGSGFVRVSPPDPSDDDVYVSAAQVKRCELVSGDRVAGPRRAPRRSERFASLVRIDTINGKPASEQSSGTRFEELPAAFPTERFRLGSEDPTVKAIEFLAPIGRGSRVTITGASRAGKSEALRRLATALAGQEDVQLSVALAGVRPEEIAEWNEREPAPGAAVAFTGSADAQDHAVELVVDQARRIAARGAHAVVLVDTLDGLHPHAARKALGAARKLADGGSLTVIATATAPVGGETTVIALDVTLTSTGRLPALDLAASGTLRPELLVGEAGAEAIARARSEALDR